MIKLLQLVFEIGAGGFIIIGVYSQMIRPLFKKTPVFPFFRKRPNFEGKIKAANESLEEQDLKRQLAVKQREIAKKQHSSK